MKRLVAVVTTSLLALSACSGGGSSAPTSGANLVPTSSAPVVSAYRVPLVHDMSVDAAVATDAQTVAGRRPSGLGGLPTIDATFTLMDAPGDYDNVNVAIVGVEAIGADGVAYAVVTYGQPVVVDLLQYKHTALVLGHTQLPKQQYRMMRLVVQSSKSSVVDDKVTFPVEFGYYENHRFTPAPSDISTVDFPISVDGSSDSVTVLADFNTVESIHIHANKVAHIGSRITEAPYNASSVIAGTIVNAAGAPVKNAVVTATDSSGTVVASTKTDAAGTFEIHAITGGSYKLTVHNSYTTAGGDTITSSGTTTTKDVVVPATAVPGGFKVDLGKLTD